MRKEIKNIKLSEARKKLFKEGKIVAWNKGKSMPKDGVRKGIETRRKNNSYASWCKGLTKETDERVRKIGIDGSKTKREMVMSGKYKPTMLGKNHSEETKKVMSKLATERYKNGFVCPWKGKPLSEEAKQRISKANKGRIMTEETRKKISQAVKIRMSSEEAREKCRERLCRLIKEEDFKKKKFRGMGKKPTEPESVVIDLIDKYNLPFRYVGDGQIVIGDFNPDFISKNPKHIIEVFGDYWHNLERVKKRDIEKLKTYTKYGYKTLVIWEHELVSNKYGLRLPEQEIINRIKMLID